MFSEALISTGYYSDQEILFFEKEARLRTVEKSEVLLNPGEVAKSVYFVLTGAIYQYNFKQNGEINIIDLHAEKDWLLSHRSFVSQTPSNTLISAFTKSTILELSIESVHFLITQSPAFLQLNKLLDQATSRVNFFDDSLTPLQKYKFIFENRPQLLQVFPLKMIASFLKITPETLSRVRDKFVNGIISS